MVKIHVEQTTDTDWEIRTGSDHEDRAVAGTVTVTGAVLGYRMLGADFASATGAK